MDLTWGAAGVVLAVLVVVCFMAGAVDTWWDQHKGDKGKGG